MSAKPRVDEQLLSYATLSEGNWKDFETLFGDKGACGGCWCMTPRLTAAEYNRNRGAGNKELFHQLVAASEPLGIVVYHENMPIAWCSVSPKWRLKQMKKSKAMNVFEDDSTWSIVCLFIHKNWRRRGVSACVIKSATAYAFASGAKTVEAYPVVPKNGTMPDVFAWQGIWKSYERAGFGVAHKLSETKLIVRSYAT